jgi:hypothetical protein
MLRQLEDVQRRVRRVDEPVEDAPFNFVRARAVEGQLAIDPAASRASLLVVDRYGRILWLGDAVAARLGFARDSLVGRRLTNRVVASARGPFLRALRAALVQERLMPMKIALRTKRNDVLLAELAPVGLRRAGKEPALAWSLTFGDLATG